MSSKNYLAQYSQNVVRKFQAGGAMPEAGAAPAGGAAPGAPDLEGMLMEYAQNRNPELAMAICDTLVQMMGASAAPAGGAPEGGMPMARNGMRLKPRTFVLPAKK